MDYYIILKENDVYTKENFYPYTLEEAKERISELDNAKCINISEDGVSSDDSLLTEEQNLLLNWREEFYNNNINGFSMPREVQTNDDYIFELQKLFEAYKIEMKKIAFKYEDNLIRDVNKNCEQILKALFSYLNGNSDNAKNIISSIINDYINDNFWVSDIDKCYAFRGIAPFSDIHSSGYEDKYNEMMRDSIDLYRARSDKIVSERKEMLHIPYDLKDKVSEQRFSLKHNPCLYLGTTSYDCWLECNKPLLEEFYISGFRLKKERRDIKIFNLVVSEPLINGTYQKPENKKVYQTLQNTMLKLFPLVISTSFIVLENEKNRTKYEYIIPQLIMQSLSDLNIDGVAYLSKRGENDFQYPHGVNLAIPINDINEKKQYGDICNQFLITDPQCFINISNENVKTTSLSYIHKTFSNYPGTKDYIKKHREFQKADDYIPAKEFKEY